MPRVVGRSPTMVLIECEHLSPKPSKRQMEQVKENVCRYCGLQRDASKRRMHMVCLHKQSPYWDKFLPRVKMPNTAKV